MAAKVEKILFDGTNYNQWRMKMKALIISKGQSGWIENNIARAAVADADDRRNYDNLTASLMMSLIGRAMTVVETIPEVDLTPHAMWSKLADEFDRKTVGSKVSLIMRLARKRQGDGESITTYLDRAETIQRQLTGQGMIYIPSGARRISLSNTVEPLRTTTNLYRPIQTNNFTANYFSNSLDQRR